MAEDPGINLEDDGPELPPVVEEPAAPVAEVPAEEPAAPVEAVEVAGRKYVPVGVMLDERRQRQALQAKADKADQLEVEVADLRPYAKFLKDNPGLLQQRQQPAPAAPQSEEIDPEAVEYARLLDLYTPDGQPDIKRATTFMKIADKRSDRRVQQAVAPVHERKFQEESARNYQLALTFKDPSGRSPHPQTLANVWRQVSAEQSADPQVSAILTATALGLDYATAKPQAAAPPPPLVTEGPGGARRPAVLSDIEQRVAKDRGVSSTDWAKSIETFKPGRANQLED